MSSESRLTKLMHYGPREVYAMAPDEATFFKTVYRRGDEDILSPDATSNVDVTEVKQGCKMRPSGSGTKGDRTGSDKRREHDRYLANKRDSKAAGECFSAPPVQSDDE